MHPNLPTDILSDFRKEGHHELYAFCRVQNFGGPLVAPPTCCVCVCVRFNGQVCLLCAQFAASMKISKNEFPPDVPLNGVNAVACSGFTITN